MVDNVSIQIPVACTMNGTNMNSHNATIVNGTYEEDIGTTTLKAFCNDAEGFAIYAAGYTGDEIGGTNSNKLVGTSASGNATIVTGLATSAGNPDVSNWAMKLATPSSPTPTYPITIDSDTNGSFSNYHIVPNEYVKVAHRDSATDIGTNAEGSTLTTTYRAYISKTQAADTYSGKVIYTLVHPAAINPNYLSVTYDGNGLFFNSAGGKATNTMQYDATSNVSSDTITETSYSQYNENGTYNGYGTPGGNKTVEINGASKLHITVTYGVPENNGGPPSDLYIWPGNHPGYTNQDNATSITSCGGVSAVDGAFKSNGNAGSQVTMECDIVGDSVTFYDYGQYDVSTGYYAMISSIGDITTYPKAVIYGSYSDPSDNENSRFLGWSEDPNAEEPAYANEADFITKSSFTNANGKITLYAIWTGSFSKVLSHAGKGQSNSHYYIQDVNSQICQKISIDETETLIDSRDNNLYMVGKLRDGNCWMLDNLSLDPTDHTTANNLNESNTNASAEAINNYLYGGSTNDGWSSTPVINYVGDSFYGAGSGFNLPRINTESKNLLVTSYGPASNNGQAKVGVYYNYCAATVGTYCYENSRNLDIPDTLVDAAQDICPANWRMPTGGDDDFAYPRQDGEYRILASKYGSGGAGTYYDDATSIDSLQYNLSTPLSGYIHDAHPSGIESDGHWWSSTGIHASTGTYTADMYLLEINSSGGVNTYQIGSRDFGYSVRCLVGE
ncbi:hypothetical protein IKD82_03215 [Candidatus Saccharibacteria bacterium]|nr:hypothetical protein [Candidatus Saccharibacteria bacterium]